MRTEKWGTDMERKKGRGNMELLTAVGFLIVWFVLQAWILPRFGVST